MAARGENLFKRNDVMRAIKSARDAGVPVAGVEITCKDGTVIRVFSDTAGRVIQAPVADEQTPSSDTNPWDEVLTNAADKERPA
jgi:hypothetical protein